MELSTGFCRKQFTLSKKKDLFRISSDGDQGKIITYIQLSTELLRVAGKR
jgi:hypothetical protein